ncbi:keratin, type I cytoskeletal 42-like [Pseudophryne corroboree]|uniref:keratin, type I cytoskeletal 42-like n=1 Tax=Pseudophryne corroboree TaxID=495146 RepID=UPI00308207BF
MQHLNQRLSSYLEKVHSLEQENAQLESKICEWYANNAPSTLPDSSQYFRTIQELQNQIFLATVDNAHIVLQIDNAQLAADDLRNKYEMELNLKNNVEADIGVLRRALEELNMQRRDLEIQLQCLQEELLQLKKSHEEEVNALQTQLGARVNVEVDAAPSMDLNKTLSEVRQQYENLMERNLKEVESIFLARSAELDREVSSGAEQLQSVSNELTDLRRSVQTLEIELQSHLSMKSALESTLAETEDTFGSQLAQLQTMIDNVESQLAQIRSDLERQNHEYKILMDQKTHLEMEIATYKRLLDGHDIHVPAHHSTEHKDRNVRDLQMMMMERYLAINLYEISQQMEDVI